MKTIVITSGYFNPIHPGHIECLELCKELGDELRVIVNNDQQARAKTGKQELFQDQDYRMRVVGTIRGVDRVFLAIDEDGSVCESIQMIDREIKNIYGPDVKVIFGKGGDRFAGNIPEVEVCKALGIEIRDGLGAKINNSKDYRIKKE